MKTVILDYGSGNLHSAAKSFQRMADELNAGEISVSSDPAEVRAADRIVLPGVGAFADCRAGLDSYAGLYEAMSDRVLNDGVPFFGICVGMQMLATLGREHGLETRGFDWIKGEVVNIAPANPDLKVPHMGWNELALLTPEHALFDGINSGDHAYFVHSYHLRVDDPADLLAQVDYGGRITAAVGRGNIFGSQFHPEKSQKTGLRIIGNFLKWNP